MKLEINNLKLHNYNISMTINENEKCGIYSRNRDVIDTFFGLISGINNNGNSIFLNKENIFDNSNYFKNRVLLDFSNKYLTTLRVNKIKNAFNDYNLSIDKDRFINICNDLNIRGETDITHKYEFTNIGNSFVNLALLCSLGIDNVIVKNPTINLSLQSDFDYFVNALTGDQFKNVILDVVNISSFKGKLDRVIFFGENNEVHILSNKDKFIVFDKDIDRDFLIKNIVYKCKKIIALDSYSKEDLKKFQKFKIKYEFISIYDVNKYFGEI